MARTGARSSPPVDPPRPLAPLFRFTRLPPRALGVALRVLDDDAAFRARVAQTATEEGVGRPGWLFLTRPVGWEAELRALAAAEAAEADEGREEREARAAVRRLRSVEAALVEARERLRRTEAEVAELRAGRAEAEERAATAECRVAALEHELGLARERVRAARADAATAASAREEAARLASDVAELRAQLEQRQEGPPGRAGGVASPSPADLAGALGALADATAAAERLRGALARAGAALVPEEPGRLPPDGRAPRRVPVPLPPAVRDDSREAADHLVRTPGAVLLVDGYNATLWGWPELSIADQRDRLVAALGELAARTGVSPHAVFDGSDEAPAPPPAAARAVQVSFSPPDVEADDVIVALVEALPAAVPVIVATNDRRVREGASRHGANLLSVAQLFAVLRR